MIFKKLNGQLFFITTAPLIFIIIAISVFFLFDSLDSADRDINQKGNYLSEQTLLLSEFYFYTGNNDEILNIAKLVMKTEDVDFIRFSDKSYNAFIYLKKDSYKDSKIFETIVYNKDTVIEDHSESDSSLSPPEILGYITLGLSNREILSKKKRIYKQILISAFLAIIGGLLITYLFSRKLLLGLNSLKETAAKIERKQLDQRCIENGSGELLKIQQVFNNMAESIQLNEKYLQEKVKTATRSLNETISELSEKNHELDRTRKIAIELERSKAILDERSRIMKDMHDGIGGQLIASLALVENEKDSVIKETITEILKHCIDDLRLIINSLSSSANTLSALLADFKYRMSKRLDSMDIRLVWVVEDAIDHIQLQPQQGLNILRILQESFTNTLKHAKASKIQLHAYQEDEHIVIHIEDNGHFTASDNCYGQGIQNMKWRAEQLSANVAIQASEKGGCSVTLSIPTSIIPK
jgi:signal transduction histidine kinase